MAMLEQTRSPTKITIRRRQRELCAKFSMKLPGPMEAAARMLPPECYTSAEFFEFERKEVFARSWLCVGRVEQVAKAGDCISAQPAGSRSS